MSKPEVITVEEHKRTVAMEALNLLKNGQRVQESTNPLKAQYFEDRQAIKESFDGIDKELDGIDKNFNGIDKSLGIANSNFDTIIARMKQLEARVKELEVFVDEIVRPSHREPQIEPKDTSVNPLNSATVRTHVEGDEVDNTRMLVLRMEQKKKHGRRLY